MVPAAKKPVPVPEGMVSVPDDVPDELVPEVEEEKDMTKVPGGKAGGAASGAASALGICLLCACRHPFLLDLSENMLFANPKICAL